MLMRSHLDRRTPGGGTREGTLGGGDIGDVAVAVDTRVWMPMRAHFWPAATDGTRRHREGAQGRNAARVRRRACRSRRAGRRSSMVLITAVTSFGASGAGLVRAVVRGGRADREKRTAPRL